MAYDPPDLDALLTPIADDGEGVGRDLRLGVDPEGLYLSLKDLRAEARAAERDAFASPDPDIPPLEAGLRHWLSVVELGSRVLEGVSKDLEVACWVCEALVRTEGFEGLAHGLELIARLVEEYWDLGLHPPEDEDGVEGRIAPLAGLLGRGMTASLTQPIKLLPLSDRRDLPVVALWTVEVSRAPTPSTEDSEARERMVARQAEQIEAINQAVSGSSHAFLRAAYAGAKRALHALDRLVQAVDVRTELGRFGSQVGEAIRNAVELLEARAGHLFAEAAPPEEGAEPTGAGQAVGRTTAAMEASGGLDRAQAFVQLLRIADFFERTEPHSLLARSLRDVVRRGQMPLTDLLSELLPERDQRTQFLLRAGIRDEAPAENNAW